MNGRRLSQDVRERWRWIGLALAVVILGCGAFFVARQVTVRGEAGAGPTHEDRAAQTGTPEPEPPVPGESDTPVPGSTPDTSKPFWYVPYLNRDGQLPLFEGEINGISMGRTFTSPADEGYCDGHEGSRSSGPIEGKFSSSPVGLRASQLPAGMRFFAPSGHPEYVVCDGDLARRSDSVVMVGLGTKLGDGTIHVYRFLGVPHSPINGPEERWSSTTVVGHPAALLKPVVESVGNSVLAVHTPNSGVTTVLWGEGVYPESLFALMEAILQ